MFEQIIELIMRHTSMMDLVLKSTVEVIERTQDKDLSAVDFLTGNRERLINGLAEIQGKTEAHIDSLIDEEITHENVEIIKAWLADLNEWSLVIQKLDDYLINFLENEKDATTKEIATVFKTKSKFKGYNLNNLRK